MTTENLIVIGAGFFTDEIIDIISLTNNFNIIAFVEGIDKEKCNSEKEGIPIVWIDDIKNFTLENKCFCAIGSPKRKGIIEKILNYGFNFTSLIHPKATIFPSASVKEGSLIGAATIVSSKSTIGRHVIINRGCLIGHHVRIDDYVTISPGANIAGKVIIKEGAYIGMGAIILDGICVGANSIIGSGAVVTKDVPDNVQVMGIPARITKELNKNKNL